MSPTAPAVEGPLCVGAFIAGGFVADPKGDFHLEIAVQGEQFAHDLASLIAGMGVKARVNPRRARTRSILRARRTLNVCSRV